MARRPLAAPTRTGLLLLGLIAQAHAAPQLVLSSCQIVHPQRLTVLPAECGVLKVPENPQEPQGRAIGLYVARVPAVSRRKFADPLFVLAGGPGQAATDFYASVAGAFGRINRDRDIVLIDQRGTGRSNLLSCPDEEDTLYRLSDAQILTDTRSCLAAVSAHASPAYYTSSIAVQDLEKVRVALGYARINLYGVSYGTRVAQQYLRGHPAQVRAVILDGVLPPQLAVGPDVALNAERALHGIFARCMAEAACRARFPDPAQDYTAVRARLEKAAVSVTVPDPSTGESRTLQFGTDQLALVLRLASYSSDYAALLPQLLHAARATGDYAPLAAQFLLFGRATSDIATGMHNSVVCAEDVPFYDMQKVDRAALAQTFMGATQVDGLKVLCSAWPHGPVDADLHAPLHSTVPALLLSGSDDPVTPPEYAAQAAQGFTQQLQIVLPGFAHGQITSACMGRVLARFLDSASVAGLDISCTGRARPMPFFLNLNGPAP